jgi:hypothetical protein
VETALFAPDTRRADLWARSVRRGGWRSLLLGAGFRTGRERSAFERLLAQAGDTLDAAPFTRLYVGHEACEHLTPGPASVSRLIAVAKRHGLAPGVVLPPTYASREAAVLNLLQTLARTGRDDLEVVCAEWGTVALVHANPPLRPVLGRIMGRMKRFERWSRSTPAPDLRAVEGADPSEVQENQRRVSRWPAWSTIEERALAEALGVTRASLDPVPQGLDPSVLGWKPLALHVPWTYVTLGRHCQLRAAVEGLEVVLHDTPCRAWCGKRVLLDDHAPPAAPLSRAGNAVYLENPSFLAAVPGDVRQAALWIVSPLP